MIRVATLEDMPALLRMAFDFHKAGRLSRLASFEDSVNYWETWLDYCIKSEYALCLIEKKASGFLVALLSPLFWNPEIRTVCIAALWVNKNSRGQGIGKELIEETTSWAREIGAASLSVSISGRFDAKRASRLYCNCGYEAEGKVYHRILKND